MREQADRTLGTTGLVVSRLGLGMAALGRPGYINLGHAADLNEDYGVGAMQDHAFAVLDAAWAGGVHYFDTARSYGRGESFLGNWLATRDIGPEAVVIASKWGYTYTADWNVNAEVHEIKEHSLRVLMRQWGETQTNLGDHLSLYQIHSATFESGVLENPEVLNELARLRVGGTHIGLTVSGPQQGAVLQAAIHLRVDGEPLFESVQVTWNVLETSPTPILAEAHARGMGVIVKEALANGRLTPKNDAPDFAPQRAALQTQAQRLSTSLDALALAAALAQPWADVVLSGAATVAHVESNLAALDVAWDDEAAHALQDLAEAPEDYWRTRGNLAWN
ncbi:MAG: aldo/keto reductase [Anaerolineales bacterium]